MKLNKILLIGVFSLTIFSSIIVAQDKEMKSDKMGEKMMKGDMMHKDMEMKVDKDENGLAIKGYDAVSYFTDMKPMMGSSKYSYGWGERNGNLQAKRI